MAESRSPTVPLPALRVFCHTTKVRSGLPEQAIPFDKDSASVSPLFADPTWKAPSVPCCLTERARETFRQQGRVSMFSGPEDVGAPGVNGSDFNLTSHSLKSHLPWPMATWR